MIKFIVVFLSLFVMMSSTAYGQAKSYGIGLTTCGRFVKVLEGHRKTVDADVAEYYMFMNWFLGYATGISSAIHQDVLRGRDTDATTLWLEGYCREHPLDKFVTASDKLLTTLPKEK